MSAALGGDDLVGFEQREHGPRILQGQLLGLDVNRNVSRCERALLCGNIRAM